MHIYVILPALLLLLSYPKAGTTLHPTGDIAASFVHEGKNRTYTIHYPKNYVAGIRYPLVLALHGGGGNATNMARQTQLNAKADEAGFIVVYPEGLPTPSGLRTWNAGACCGLNAARRNTDDIGFLDRLIDTMVALHGVDAKRVYATGHSNGAMMCYRLANERSQKITAIAPNAGAFQMETPYRPTRNVPVLHIHSLLDENAVYTGGPGKNSAVTRLINRPVDSCLQAVAAHAGCNSGRQIIASHPQYTIYQWGGCTNSGMKVLLYLTKDGGHSWPGGNAGRLAADPPSKAFRNNDVIWDFFKHYSL